jgi:hypothetical protein
MSTALEQLSQSLPAHLLEIRLMGYDVPNRLSLVQVKKQCQQAVSKFEVRRYAPNRDLVFGAR